MTSQNVILVYTKTNYQQNFLTSKEMTDYETLHKIKMTIQIFPASATKLGLQKIDCLNPELVFVSKRIAFSFFLQKSV